MIFSGCLGGLQVTHLDGASYHHPKIWENQHLGMGQCFFKPSGTMAPQIGMD
jgi:hypothetical protein